MQNQPNKIITQPFIPVKKCQHCGKPEETLKLKESYLCPHCQKDLRKAPKGEKGQFIDTDSITKKQLVRIDDWAMKIMQKHEHLFTNDVPIGKPFIQEELKPEDVDIPQIYDFTGLCYKIYRKLDTTWMIRILQNNKIVLEVAYAKD